MSIYLVDYENVNADGFRGIEKLGKNGIRVIVLTGDNAEVTRCICDKVGIMSENIILGSKLDRLSAVSYTHLTLPTNSRV